MAEIDKQAARAALSYIVPMIEHREYYLKHSGDKSFSTTQMNAQRELGHFRTIQKALEAQIAGGWRPIETAPKDGIIIDVWLGNADDSETEFYCPDGTKRSSAWVWGNGKFRPVTGLPGMMTVFVQPTHWQPLPAAPEGVKP